VQTFCGQREEADVRIFGAKTLDFSKFIVCRNYTLKEGRRPQMTWPKKMEIQIRKLD